jgi:hypothetical protein
VPKRRQLLELLEAQGPGGDGACDLILPATTDFLNTACCFEPAKQLIRAHIDAPQTF